MEKWKKYGSTARHNFRVLWFMDLMHNILNNLGENPKVKEKFIINLYKN